jgi:antitoxin (DNA-binding transcriptional repressor) of toxin-antitoxin stability system
MERNPSEPERVGVRELRQHLSVYLRRIAGGEEFTVTERGKPVARLGALPPASESIIDRMIADGRAIPAKDPGAISRLPVWPPDPPGAPSTEQLMDESREDIV